MRVSILLLIGVLALSLAALSAGSFSGDTVVAGTDANLQGDADCNGAVNSQDAASVLLQAAGAGSAGCASRANVDCQSGINAFDALLIVKFDAGLGAGGAGGCIAIGSALPESSGEELIDQALDAGQIDISTAVLYKAYWAFGEPRLPAQYNSPADHGDIPDDVLAPPDGVSQAVLDELVRYQIPPAYEDSWYYDQSQSAQAIQPAEATPAPISPNWVFVDALDEKVKVWFDQNIAGDYEKATDLSYEVDVIWAKYKDLLGVEPLPDGSLAPGRNGGDARFDIYLVNLTQDRIHGAFTMYDPPASSANPCPAAAGYVEMNNADTIDQMKGTLAHELFHAFQRAMPLGFPCSERKWFLESTATWAEDFVYPQGNTERAYEDFKHTSGKPIFDWDRDGYGAWPFWFYLARSDSPQVIADIFDYVQTHTLLESIDAKIFGGFQDRWPEFALYAWNYPPEDKFQQWDGLDWHQVYRSLGGGYGNPPDALTLGENETSKDYSAAPSRVEALGMEYYHLTIPAPGDGQKDPSQLQINNPFTTTPAGVAVQIAYMIDGAWHTEDITGVGGRSFCRNTPGNRVTEVVVIISNSNLPPAAPSPEFSKPLAVVRDACGWTGEAHAEHHFTTGLSGGDWTVTVDATNLVFKSNGLLLSGNVKTTYAGVYYSDTGPTPGNCTVSGSGEIQAAENSGSILITSQDATSIHYSTSGFVFYSFPITVQCPGDPPSQQSGSSQFWVQVEGQVSNNLNLLEGTATKQTTPDASVTYNWHYER